MQLGDGGLGSYLQSLGLPADAAPEIWNLLHPEHVAAAHAAFAVVGASWLQTNTFGATSSRLTLCGLAERVAEVNRAAIQCVRRGAPGVRCLGSVGPTMSAHPEELGSVYQQQIEALLDAGVDGIIIETIVRIDEGVAAVTAARDLGAACLWASFTPAPDGNMLDGSTAEAAATALARAGAQVIGVNCGSGPESLAGPVQRLLAMALTPVLAMPSAGLPRGRPPDARYPVQPDAFAEAAIQFREMGVQYFAGCCGVGPDHLRAAAQRLALSPPGD